jgi:hypothetical protein
VVLDIDHNPTLTDKGLQALETYENLPMPTRLKPGALPEYVNLMFRIMSSRTPSYKKRRGRAA